ncbi:uncharacterized protein LOC122141674 [Cyprinus carpio]|uniref:Uncharacterized protein LOC122141674 n=2 Tax=Cyprinus carpio TaxID=7962 RepID=A0A9Q9XQP6_CYPCA|nr:uncharacterized protein LOC122141674 [Cyprinus carpio]
MRILIVSLCLLLLHIHGVSGAGTDAIENVLVMEGDSATLHAGETQAEDLKVWTFGPDETIIARNSEIKMFKDRLLVDQSTGSLTIENITANFSGIYKLEIVKKNLYKNFNVTVYGSLWRKKALQIIKRKGALRIGHVTWLAGQDAGPSSPFKCRGSRWTKPLEGAAAPRAPERRGERVRPPDSAPYLDPSFPNTGPPSRTPQHDKDTRFPIHVEHFIPFSGHCFFSVNKSLSEA